MWGIFLNYAYVLAAASILLVAEKSACELEATDKRTGSNTHSYHSPYHTNGGRWQLARIAVSAENKMAIMPCDASKRVFNGALFFFACYDEAS